MPILKMNIYLYYILQKIFIYNNLDIIDMYNAFYRQINKRFQRLESHVVTLARSIAHLSSEMRTHNKISQDVEELKRDMTLLKERPGTNGAVQTPVGDWERFRGWVPQITNPKRVKKLTK